MNRVYLVILNVTTWITCCTIQIYLNQGLIDPDLHLIQIVVHGEMNLTS